MQLPNVFKSRARKAREVFQAAFAANDTVKLGEVLDAGFELSGQDRAILRDDSSLDMLKLYVQKDFPYLNRQCNWRGSEGMSMALQFVRNKALDRLEVLFAAGMDFSRGSAFDHPIEAIFYTDLDSKTKLALIEKFAVNGIDRLEQSEKFLYNAINADFPAAFDLLVGLGLNPKADNEAYLRHAAQWQKKDMCLHLIEKHGADIDVAKAVARADEHEIKAYVFLCELENTAAPKAPASLDSVSSSVDELRRLVLELTVKVEQLSTQNRVVKLDKPGLEKK